MPEAPYAHFFDNGTIDQHEFDTLASLCRAFGVRTVLEFGPGVSTFAFLEAGCTVTSFEAEPKWLEIQQTRLAGRSVTIHPFDSVEALELPALMGRRFDLAFIDAPCAEMTSERFTAYARHNTCAAARPVTNLIVMHDANRPVERLIARYFAELGWLVSHIPTSRGLFVFTRPPLAP